MYLLWLWLLLFTGIICGRTLSIQSDFALPIFSSLKKKSCILYCCSGCYCSHVLIVDGLCSFRVTCPSNLFFFKKKKKSFFIYCGGVHRYYSWTLSIPSDFAVPIFSFSFTKSLFIYCGGGCYCSEVFVDSVCSE